MKTPGMISNYSVLMSLKKLSEYPAVKILGPKKKVDVE